MLGYFRHRQASTFKTTRRAPVPFTPRINTILKLHKARIELHRHVLRTIVLLQHLSLVLLLMFLVDPGIPLFYPSRGCFHPFPTSAETVCFGH